jgi:hypothetical protein
MQEICTGAIGWTAQAFWDATFQDVCAAIDGWLFANGHSGQKIHDVPDKQFLEEMMRKFPDG